MLDAAVKAKIDNYREEEEEEEEEDLFVFNDTIEGPRAPAVKPGTRPFRVVLATDNQGDDNRRRFHHKSNKSSSSSSWESRRRSPIFW